MKQTTGRNKLSRESWLFGIKACLVDLVKPRFSIPPLMVWLMGMIADRRKWEFSREGRLTQSKNTGRRMA